MNEQNSDRNQNFRQTELTNWLAIIGAIVGITSLTSLPEEFKIVILFALFIIGILSSARNLYSLRKRLRVIEVQGQIIYDIRSISKSNFQKLESVEQYIHFVTHTPINTNITLLKLTNAQVDEVSTIYKMIRSDFILLRSELLTGTQDLESSTITYLFLQLRKAYEISILLDYYDCIVNYFRGRCDDLLAQNPPDEAIFSDLNFRPNLQLIQLIHDITVADHSSENLSRSSDVNPQSDENDDIQPNVIDDDDENQRGTS